MHPRSLYVHIPFCASKCFYCAFNSRAGGRRPDIDAYLDALLQELAGLPDTEQIITLYVGGGTPSILEPDQLELLLGALARRAPRVQEWTLEVNPGSLDDDRAGVLASSGVKRVSMGVQTFERARLESLGRTHLPEDVARTVELLRSKGIDDLNLDLIYGLPDQGLDAWLGDVRRLLEQDSDHVSLYALQYEEGTRFQRDLERGRLGEAPEELVLRMQGEAGALLAERGLERYEISNYARPGHESRHNLTYWRNEPYFGIGAGAWSRVGTLRQRNICSAEGYARAIRERGEAVEERDQLGAREDYLECLCAGLRTREGVDLDQLLSRTGLDPRVLHGDHLRTLEERDLACLAGSRLRLTDRGLWLLDSLLEGFLTPALEAPVT